MRKSYVYATLIALVLLIIVGSFSFKIAARQTGERLLKDFYNFDLQTIVNNDADIKKITTESIYQSHTLSSNNRQLRVYLKFSGHVTSVNIISHKGNTIFYSINNREIDPERVFAMQYKYAWGKIYKLVEYEIFFLPQSQRSDLVD